MTGMPIRAIVLETGIGPGAICDSRSAPKPIMAPVNKLAGRMILCEEVLRIALAMCGAVIPTKPKGPQNAVTAPVSMQQLISEIVLILPVSAPDISANSSPNMIMSSPLRLRMAVYRPITALIPTNMICSHVLFEKLPADQL